MEQLTALFQQATTYLSGILDELKRQNRFDLTRQNLTQNITATLAAGEQRTLYTSFRSMTVLSVSTASGVQVSFGQGNGATVNPLYQGLVFKTPRPDIFVDNFTLYNTTAGPVTIEVMVGFMDVDDNRLNVTGALNISKGLNIAGGTVSVGTAVGPATTIAAASPSRRALNLYNNGSATVFLGPPGSVTTANGFPLLPGGFASFSDSAAALWGGVAASGTVDVRVSEELD